MLRHYVEFYSSICETECIVAIFVFTSQLATVTTLNWVD